MAAPPQNGWWPFNNNSNANGNGSAKADLINGHEKLQNSVPISGAQNEGPQSLPIDSSVQEKPSEHTKQSPTLTPKEESFPDTTATRDRSTFNVSTTASRARKRAANEDKLDDVSETESQRIKRPRTPPSAHDPASTQARKPNGINSKRISDRKLRQSPDRNSTRQSHPPPTDRTSSEHKLFRQPETRPITEDQLVQEVKGIYAGLVMVEKKCIEIVQQQSQSASKLTNEQWQALIALHRTLLHEHHDFFSASQHPTASTALRRLATKYAMPARMWRHGIHAFLELLRHRLPESLDHMLSFVYLAYSMMALLMESIPSFEETWIECLGDLARYRMAIEEADLRDRENWSNVARYWYNKAADLSPNVGRIMHHLAVLARPNIVQQLFYYSKALVSVIPFPNARESIMLLFSPLLDPNSMIHPRYPDVEGSLVTGAGILFTRRLAAEYRTQSAQCLSNLDNHLARSSAKFKFQGPEIVSSLMAMMMDFGNGQNQIWNHATSHMEGLIALECKKTGRNRKELPQNYVVTDPEIKKSTQEMYWKTMTVDTPVRRVDLNGAMDCENIETSDHVTAHAGLTLYDMTSAIAARIGDKNIVPYMHALLASLWGLSFIPHALPFVEATIPWTEIVMFLNTLGRSGISYDTIESEIFPQRYGGTGRQLPEDFAMRGLVTTQYYFQPDWFTVQVVDEDERLLDFPSHQAPRAERCLWCGVRLASLGRYLTYDEKKKEFAATDFAAYLATLLPNRSSQGSAHTFETETHPMTDVEMQV